VNDDLRLRCDGSVGGGIFDAACLGRHFVAPFAAPVTYGSTCFVGTGSVFWNFVVTPTASVITYVQESPPNPDGSFYVTFWGHNFGSQLGQIEICLAGANPCASSTITVSLSASQGNAYFAWCDIESTAAPCYGQTQINALVIPSPEATYGV
jgi:hypothetical protein